MKVPTKRLPGAYSLSRFEGGVVVLIQGPDSIGDESVVKGAVEQLGWSDHYIVGKRNQVTIGKRHAMESDLRPGWMIINVQTNEIKGPFTDAEFAEAVRQDSSLASIKIWPVDEAWERLG